MTLNEKKCLLTVVLSDNPTPTEQKLARWLVEEWETIAAEQEDITPSHDEGKPKTPLPNEEAPSSSTSDFDEDFLPESDVWEARDQTASQTKVFLMGLIFSWLMIGAGGLIFLTGRKAFHRLTEFLDVSPDILIGVSLLYVLAMLLRRNAKELASRFAAWLCPEF